MVAVSAPASPEAGRVPIPEVRMAAKSLFSWRGIWGTNWRASGSFEVPLQFRQTLTGPAMIPPSPFGWESRG